jgi:hypothetical protein
MVERTGLKQIERNVFREYFRDGLVDILFGMYFLLTGLLLGGTATLFVFLSVVFFAPLLRSLKKRFTYPRTGYVELRQGDPQPRPWFILGSLALGLAALVAVSIATDVITQPAKWYRLMPIFFGIWMAGILLGLALRVGLQRYYVAAGVVLASGLTFALMPPTEKLENIRLFLDVVGTVLLACGVIAFVRFVRKHPLPTEGAADVAD